MSSENKDTIRQSQIRMSLKDLFQLILVPLAGYAVHVLSDLNANVSKLNVQVGVIIAERAYDKEEIKDLKVRVKILETIKQAGH